MDRDRVVIAEVLRPRGKRGEVLARSQSDVPGRLETLTQAQARLASGEDVPVEIAEAWAHKGDWVLKFAGVDSIAAAERFRGADLWIPAELRGALPEGEFFASDLIGCSLVDAGSRAVVGTVEGWEQHGAAPLMQVRVDGREALIPFVAGICRTVDLAARVITVELPEGLLEL
jgi:16S rRNA processing protein RimM